MVCGASGLLLGVQRARLHQSRDADHYDRADLTHREHCVRSFAPQRNGEGGSGRVSLGAWRAAARPAPWAYVREFTLVGEGAARI